MIKNLIDAWLFVIWSGFSIYGILMLIYQHKRSRIIKKKKMEDLKLVKRALDKATQKGAFSFDEAAVIINAYQSLEMNFEKMRVQLEQYERKEQQKEETIKPAPGKTKK